MSWEALFQDATKSLIESGPVALVLVALIVGIGIMLRRFFLTFLWPWVTATAHKALEEAKMSREQRDKELHADRADKETAIREKEDMHRSFQLAIKASAETGRLIAEKIEALNTTSLKERSEMFGHVRAIDGKVDDIQRHVKTLVPRRQHEEQHREVPSENT